MNTKNFLFTCLFLLVTFTAATVVYKQKSLLPISAEAGSGGIQVEIPLLEYPDPVADTKPHHPDDDGKYHDFHFDRILHFRRGRYACIFCAKTVLAIIHLAALLLGYFSVGH